MEINANIKLGSVNGVTSAKRSAGTPAAADNDSFASSAALEGALQNAPDVRPDAVAAGRALVGTDGYPPADTIKKLSNLLANHLAGLE